MSGLENLGDDLKQYSWMPKTSEEQLNLGLELINYAYTNHYTALENEILALTEKVRDLGSRLRDAESKLSESALVLQDLAEKNVRLAEENERLTNATRKLRVENTRLLNLANTIKSTINNNETQQIDMEPKPNKQLEEDGLRNTNRAQQLINQIEISLQHNPVANARAACGEGKALGSCRREHEAKMKTVLTPGSSLDTGKRFQFPKFSSKLNQFSRNVGESQNLPHEHYTQHSRAPLDEAYQIENSDCKRFENGAGVGGIHDSAAKSDKANSQYEGGKSFFKEARKILPFDKFNYFLQQIKLMNKGQKSKESIIKVAEGLFSRENYRMLETFKQLINNKANAPLFT